MWIHTLHGPTHLTLGPLSIQVRLYSGGVIYQVTNTDPAFPLRSPHANPSHPQDFNAFLGRWLILPASVNPPLKLKVAPTQGGTRLYIQAPPSFRITVLSPPTKEAHAPL